MSNKIENEKASIIKTNYYHLADFDEEVELGYRTKTKNKIVARFPLDQVISEWLDMKSGIEFVSKPWWECED